MVFVSELIFIAVLLLTNFALKQSFFVGRILCACFFVCIFAAAFPIINLGGMFLFAYRILTSLIVCVIATKLKIRQFLLYFGTYIIFMFMLFGAGDFMSYILPDVSIWAIFPATVLCSVGLVKIINLFYAKKRIHNFVYNVEITAQKTVVINAFLDSGNGLIDKETSLPVVMINLRTFIKLFGMDIKSVMGGNLTEKVNGRYIECDTVGGRHRIFVFEPKALAVDGKAVAALVGVSFASFGEEYDCLLNRLIVV